MGDDKSNRRTTQSSRNLIPLSFAKVVIETSVPHLDREYDYAIPDQLSEAIQIGSRVQVPFGRQKLNGWVVEKFSKSAYESKIAQIIKPLGLIASLKPDILFLTQITAQHFVGTVSDVIRFAVPPRSAAVEKNYQQSEIRHSEQNSVDLQKSYTPQFLLLKTTESWQEVTWRQISRVLSANQKVLLVVPEHDQINQFLDYFKVKESKKTIAVLSAESAPSERYKNFLDILFGKIEIVVGTRNAIFAPLSGNFAIFILNEHSDIYQSPQAPYWQVAKVANWRFLNENCELTYLGYGMSIVRFQEIQNGEIELKINENALTRMSQVYKDSDSKIKNTDDYSATLWQALAESKYGPVLVQVPRKGLANLLLCETCFRVLSCKNCSGILKLIDNSAVPKCLRCASLHGEVTCRHCGSSNYRILQSGQTGVLKTLGIRFPGVKIHSSTKEKRVFRVDESPSITVCTPGAAPQAKAGYRSIVLLNAATSFSNPKLEVVTEVFNQWLSLLAQLKNHPQAKFVINGDIDDTFFNFIKHENILEFLSMEYEQRKAAGLPPVLASVVLRGDAKGLTTALAAVAKNEEIKVLGPVVDPYKSELLQAAILGKEINSLLEIAKNVARGASLKGKESLQVKVESIDFI